MITRSTLRWPLRQQSITLVHLGLIFLFALGMLGQPDSAGPRHYRRPPDRCLGA